jgi:hypothetical protein
MVAGSTTPASGQAVNAANDPKIGIYMPEYPEPGTNLAANA